MDDRRWLAVIAVVLALICAWLALAWRREHHDAECWRDYGEIGIPPAGSCAGPST